MTQTVTDPSDPAANGTDPATRPQDDLYRHVNGSWVAATPIPDDKARYGAFTILAEEADEEARR